MKKISKIFPVTTTDPKILKNLGQSDTYFSFGYNTDFLGYRVCVFNPQNFKYGLYLKEDAKEKFIFLKDESVKPKYELYLLKKLKEKTTLNFTGENTDVQ